MSSGVILSLQQRLREYSKVDSLHLDARADGYYDLTLVLAEESGALQLRVVFLDVSNLRIESFGGGLTQLRLLRIEDISDRQLDRIRFHVKELEDAQFECDCFDVRIKD
jgi:hypothetical protein